MFSNICLSVNSLIHHHFLYCPPPPSPRFLRSASPFSDQQLTQDPKCIHRPTRSTFHIQKVWSLKDGGSRGVYSAAAELSLFPRHRQLSVYWTTALIQKVITLRRSGLHLCAVNPRVEIHSYCCLTMHSGLFQV